jgi:hypothetical protein
MSSFELDATVMEELIRSTDGTITRWVHDGVSYGVFQEMGTHKMAAQPFMRPSIEANRRGFERALRQGGLGMIKDPVAVVEKVAFDVLAGAQIRCPVDTGALVNSLSVSEERP